jgi:hypothetical protein
MFCPRCATENKQEEQQRYCRHCGLTLAAVRLALEGQVDEAIRQYKRSANALDWGFLVLLISGLSVGTNALFRFWPAVIFVGTIGFVLGITLLLIGLSRMGRADKVLAALGKKAEKDAPALDQSEQSNAVLPPAPITAELRQTPARPPSVVENTTLELKERK